VNTAIKKPDPRKVQDEPPAQMGLAADTQAPPPGSPAEVIYQLAPEGSWQASRWSLPVHAAGQTLGEVMLFDSRLVLGLQGSHNSSREATLPRRQRALKLLERDQRRAINAAPFDSGPLDTARTELPRARAAVELAEAKAAAAGAQKLAIGLDPAAPALVGLQADKEAAEATAAAEEARRHLEQLERRVEQLSRQHREHVQGAVARAVSESHAALRAEQQRLLAALAEKIGPELTRLAALSDVVFNLNTAQAVNELTAEMLQEAPQ
jgi:hypothetical protein